MRYQSIYNRLRRIEGQVRGIEEMVASDKPISSILIQLEAAKSSLSSTISALIEGILKKKNHDRIELTEEEAKIVLRSIKKN